MRFPLPSALLLAALVIAGCDSQGPEALTQNPAAKSAQDTSTPTAQSSALYPGEITINSARTVTIRDLSDGGELLSRKRCGEFNNQGIVRIESDGDFPNRSCTLRFVNDRSSALIYYPDTERPLLYSFDQEIDDPRDADMILNYAQGNFSFAQKPVTQRVEVRLLQESLRFGEIETLVRPTGRPYIDAPWTKTFGSYTLDHGRVRTEFRRKGSAQDWITASDNVSATSGVIRITPSRGHKTFEFRIVSLLDQRVIGEAEHVFDDPRDDDPIPGVVSISGPSDLEIGESGIWTGGVTPPPGASEVSRTWRLRDGPSLVTTSTDDDFFYTFSGPPTFDLAYDLFLDVTFSDGSAASSLLSISVGDGREPCPGSPFCLETQD